MKLSEFNEFIRERWVLLKANILFTAQKELAYAGNNWTSFLSTFIYTIAMLVFIKVIYSNVQSLAGYSYNEMLLFFLVSQTTYYGNILVSNNSLNDVIPDVNNGNLDMILVKPVPSLFFLMTRSISIVTVITNAVPPILAIVFSIHWHSFNFTLLEIIIGILVWIMGLIVLQTIQLLGTIPVFWFGESDQILDLAVNTSTAFGTMIPLQGYSMNLQKLFSTILPILISSGFTASILLGKSNPIHLLIWAFLGAAVSLFVENIVWKLALKHYTSASS